MSLKTLAKETAIYGLSNILGRLLNYLLVPLYVRIFEPEVYGIVVEMYAYLGFFIVLYSYRMETAFFRFGSRPEDMEKSYATALTAVATTTMAFTAGLLAFSGALGHWMESPNASFYVKLMAVVLCFDSLTALPFAKLRIKGKALFFATTKLIGIGLNIGCNLFFLLLCPYLLSIGEDWILNIYNPEIGVGYVFISNVLASGIAFFILLPSYFELPKKGVPILLFVRFNKQMFKKMLSYCWPLIIVGLAYIINETLDRILLKKILIGSLEERNAQIGIYGANYKLAQLITIFTQAFNYAAEPFFFKNADRKDSKHLYARVGLVFAIIGLLGFLGIMLYLDIFQEFISESYHEGLVVVPILLMANLCLGLYLNVAVWYKLSDQTIYGTYVAVIGASITIGLNILLIPMIGYVGSAWTTLAAYSTMLTVGYFIGQKHYPIPYPVRKILAYIVFALGIYGSSLFLDDQFALSGINKFLIHSALMSLFLVVVYRNEKAILSEITQRK